MTFSQVVCITGSTGTSSDSTGSDFTVDETDTEEVVIADYPCDIIDNPSYKTSEKGESYTGKAKMKGAMTDRLARGMVVDDMYKIVSQPYHNTGGRYTECKLVRI